MKIIGDTVHIQQGETWSLDFNIITEAGHPLILSNKLKNPFLVITISKNMYAQTDDFKEVYWLDLNNRYVEDEDGKFTRGNTLKFTSTEPLYLEGSGYSVEDILDEYPMLSSDKSSEFYIRNFLFYRDPNRDGKYVYEIFAGMVGDSPAWYGEGFVSRWATFRIVKSFDTKDWSAGTYLFDVKIVDGELTENSEEPLAPDYRTISVLQYPTTIYVGTNLQGGN